LKRFILFLIFLTLGSAYAQQSLNPDISVVGEFNISKDTASGQYVPGIGELELGITAPIDPYSTATVILSHSASGVEIEEGFMKISSLPFDLQAKLGRMRVDFNHLNQLHSHELPFIEYPKYLQDFFGNDGLIKNGAEISYLLPLGFYSEIKAQWLSGDSDNSFAASQGIAGLKWKNFFEVGDAGGLEIGFSQLQGINNSGLTPTADFKNQISGMNIRYKHILGPQSYLVFNNEWLWSRSDYNGFVSTHGNFNYVGYQMDQYWQGGVGINDSQTPDGTTIYHDTFVALHYKWTEFQSYRLKYYRDGQNNDGILFTLNFILGPHPVHEF
jgi:hypothetical protein